MKNITKKNWKFDKKKENKEYTIDLYTTTHLQKSLTIAKFT